MAGSAGDDGSAVACASCVSWFDFLPLALIPVAVRSAACLDTMPRIFFKHPLARGGELLVYYALVRPIAGRFVRQRGGAIFDSRFLRKQQCLCEGMELREGLRNTRDYFSESLILAQNERW